MKTAQLGTVSHGTLRPEDLLSSFISTLEGLVLVNGDTLSLPENFRQRDRYARLIGEAQDAFASDGETLTEEGEENAPEIISDLCDALSDFAPTGAYFGTLEGDGSDFGFWSYPIGQGETPEGFIDYRLPAPWASYLMNGDARGLETGEQERIDAFLKSEGLSAPVDCESEAGFCHSCDAPGELAGNCLLFRFPIAP